MAAPHIAGLAALVVAAKPSLTPAQVESAIKANARPLPGTCTGGCGTGIADAAATIAAVTSAPAPGFENGTNVNILDNTTVEPDHRQRSRGQRPGRAQGEREHRAHVHR